MGILRTDRVSGLGGANAIKGSTKFSKNRLLEIHGAESNEDFRLSNGSFTIEFWAYIADTTNSTFVGLFENNPARRSWQFEARSNQALRFEWWTDGSSGSNLTSSTGSFIRDRWQHFAVVRNGTALNIYVDGTSVANTTTSDTFYENTIEPLTIGGVFQSGALTQDIFGFISNLRIIKGEAIYTANFTPPTSELTVTSNTVVLACQSPGNILQEATGKTIVATTSATNNISDSNNTPPEASHFTPNSPVGFSTTTDVGTQFGSTFDGVTTFDSQAYMVPPGGNTRERNRGRGLLGGSNDGSPFSNSIQFITIQSQGNSMEFGDLTLARSRSSSYASSTRGIWGGGQTPSETDRIDFVTIASTGNATDFGNLTLARIFCSGTSSATRGLTVGGVDAPATVNRIDFTTIASAGDAQDFGDLLGVKASVGALSSTTRAVFGGGYSVSNPSAATNDITSLTIATLGDSVDFGDLTNNRRYLNGVSSNTRGVFGSGSIPAANNTIDFITIASAGDAVDFGDATIANEHRAGISNSIRGVNAGSGSPAIGNTIDFITIASAGDAIDFGDTTTNMGYTAGCSDSHGGLS